MQNIYSLMLLLLLTLYGCKGHQITSQHLGTWTNQQVVKLQSRSKENGQYIFSQGYVAFELTLHDDQHASGKIGEISFDHVPVNYNHGLPPSVTGIEYIVHLQAVGKIFQEDLQNERELELWLKPIEDDGKLVIEIRDGSTGDAFPMGEAHLVRK